MPLGALLRELSWPEWRHHPWRHLAALAAVMLGVALAFSVQLINQSALSEFSSAVRAVNGQPDFELRGQRAGFDEALYARVAAHPGVALASPVLEVDTQALVGGAEAAPPDAAPASGRGNADAPPPGAASATGAAAAPQRIALRVLGIDALVAAPMSPALMPQPDAGAGRFAIVDPDAVFLNAAARARLGAGEPAGTLRLLGPDGPFTLTRRGGVAAGGTPVAVMDLAGAQARFGRLGRLSRIDVRLRPGADRAAVLRELALPAGVRAAAPDEAAQRVSNVSRAYRVNLTVLALVALFTGAFLVFSILSLSVAKRQPQLALLGVLGLSARERLHWVLAESALLGAAGALLGLALGTGLAALALRLLAGDLGGGYFPGVAPALQWDALSAAVYGLLGVVAALVGGWLPARAAQRLAPAQALKGLGPAGDGHGPAWFGPAMLAAGVALSLLPPVADMPLFAYVGVAALLLGGIACVPGGVGLLLRGVPPPRGALALLAVECARHQRHTATIAVAGVVASLSLAVALTVMVASFRDSVIQWLDAVLPADLYARSSASAAAGDVVTLPPELVAQGATLPGVLRLDGQRVTPVILDPARVAVALIAKPLPDPAKALPLVGELLPMPVDGAGAGATGNAGAAGNAGNAGNAGAAGAAPAGAGATRPDDAGGGGNGGLTAAYVSEAMVSLYGAAPGMRLELPLPDGPQAGRRVPLYVRGVWRDYARQHGAVMLDLADYRRLTGDRRVNDLAIWLAPGTDPARVQADLRALATRLGVDGALLEFGSPGEIRATSLRIFDRSFAVTYWLQAVAIAIGLFGIAASFSAQVLARRKEFGLLVHLGLTRRQVLQVVAVEGAVWTAAGAALGLALGIAVSVVLVDVVNPQSFHWTMELRLPWPRLALLCLAVMAAGTLTAWLAARRAAAGSMALAVKEDW